MGKNGGAFSLMEPAAESLGTIEPLMTEGRKCALLNVSMNCGEDVTNGPVFTLRALGTAGTLLRTQVSGFTDSMPVAFFG